jgi:DNA-binding SARP family transcriptional activator
MLSLLLLGPARASAAGRALKFPDRKGIALLALLALDGPSSRARLAQRLWDEDSGDARRNLRRILHRLREAGFEGFVSAQGESLALTEDLHCDVLALRVAMARADDDTVLRDGEAVLLDGLDGSDPFHDWLASQRTALRSAWAAAAERQADLLAAHAQWREALALAQRLARADELNESHCRRCMALHLRLGEREAALATYERWKEGLQRELGLSPLAETQALAEQARRGHDRLDAEVALAASGPSAWMPSQVPLVGREALLAQLRAALQAHPLVLLSAPAGAGKSRVVQALAGAPGHVLLETRPGDRRVGGAALARWLRGVAGTGPFGGELPAWVPRALAGLLPERAAPSAATPAIADQGLQLFEAARLWLERRSQGVKVWVFEDWHHVDELSAQWWAWWMGQREPNTPAVLVSLRPATAAPEPAALVDEVTRQLAAPSFDLPALSEDEVCTLIAGLSGVARPQRFARRLWKVTAGQPLYLVETLRHLLQSAVVQSDAQGRWQTAFDDITESYDELPIAPSVQGAVMQRMQALGDAAMRLLQALCLDNDELSLAQLQAASALDERSAVAALEQALAAQVLQRSGQGFRFAHELFGQVLEPSLSPERRALLHRTLAQRLLLDGAAPSRLAHHFEWAGETALACEWHVRALESAHERASLGQAQRHAQRAQALHADATQRLRIALASAQALQMQARGAEALATLDEARRALRQDTPLALRVRLTSAWVMQGMRSGGKADALDALSRLLNEASAEVDLRAELLAQRGRVLRLLGRLDEAAADFDAVLALAGDEPSDLTTEVLDDLARIELSRRNFDAAWSHAQACAHSAQRLRRTPLQCSAWLISGVVRLMQGRFAEAVEMLLQSRAAAAQNGLVGAERSAILNLASGWLALGERDKAQRAVDEGYALSRQFSHAAEEQALLEARYQLRVDSGELGGAWALHETLVTASMRLDDQERRASGLSVAFELPLMLAEPERVEAVVVATRQALGEQAAGVEIELAGMLHAKLAMAACLQGAAGQARVHLDAAEAQADARPEALGLKAVARMRCASADGDAAAAAQAARAAQALPLASMSSELQALLCAQALMCGAAAERAHWLAQARAQRTHAQSPPLSALLLADALHAQGELEEPAQASALARQLHGSLASQPRAQAALARRFAAWLPGTATRTTDP